MFFQKIFLLLDELNSFSQRLRDNIQVDFFHHFNKDIFKDFPLMLINIVNYEKSNFTMFSRKTTKGILKRFQLTCSQCDITSVVIVSFKNRMPEEGEVYIVLDDNNHEKNQEKKITLANDIGVISVNNNLLKLIVKYGIITITMNFNG
ncbi:hypothetical protein [Polaribacter sp. Asnod6-C07]|uniref:hypothetical protein n=1 Tax=Polaribacter sp. Asnod6-C07 TaxID=3160582 RepID=UPI00386BD209